jgi:anti-anti-sigma regulatory factor
MYHQLKGKPESAVQAATTATGRGDRTLTVGLDAVCHIDAPVISSLVTALRRMRDARGTVRLHVTRPDLLAALHQVGLDRVFTITSSADEPRPKAGPRRSRKRAGWARRLAGGFAGIFGAILVLDSFARAAIGMGLR